jgi:exonuclease I
VKRGNLQKILKILITNKCTESFFINCNTLLHVSTLLGHLQGELSVVVTLWLHSTFSLKCIVQH